MEYQAMLSAMELVPEGAYVCIESDSQGCIDGITKWRKRWEKHSWHQEGGAEVENAEIIKPLVAMIDKREVGFRKVKGHSGDQQSSEVVIQLIFRAVINKKEKFVGFDRFSIQALANICNFWPRLVAKCGDVIGAPFIEGEQYEIISRRTPGFVLPSEIRAQRRSSIDFGKNDEKPALPPSGKVCEAPQVAPPPRKSEEEAEGDVPPHMRVSVTFQDQSGEPKEWRGWQVDDDTEDSIERKARNALGILGSWRRLSFWRDHEGIRLVMTNSGKEVESRYQLDGETEVREIRIGYNESPTSFLTKIEKKDDFHILDAGGQEFQVTNNLFAYATTRGA
jgi:hypothetical protein